MSDAWLTEEQTQLRESVLRYVDRAYDFQHRRELAASEYGFGQEHWQQFAALGWLAAPVPEPYGGLGGSLVDVAVLMEAFGHGLVLEPYLSSVVLGAGAVVLGGGDALKSELLPDVVEGKRLLAFAHGEPQSRYDLTNVQTRATPDGAGWRVSGHKSVVLGGSTADQIVVSVRTAGATLEPDGLSLVVVDRNAEGVSVRGYRTVDGLRAADVSFDDVFVRPERILGEPGKARTVIEQTLNSAIVAVCAEAVGIMDVLVSSTRDYLKTREQFGGPISRFQVLQHRVVDMFVAHEMSRSLTYRAAGAVAGDASASSAASAAKVQIGKAGRLIGQEAIQLHGGMGMTDDLAVGHYFKRLTMIGKLFG
ncbi:MAG: acyl-CoA dehydrogenase family protein, partial [Gammaproteobacteria bacterium]